tara:strand:+ start:17342 stop:17953 length:612 start_codon:yes stop_codon:yes gene_type:complete
MRLIKLNDQGGIARYPYTLRMLKKDNPLVSLPKNPSDETLASLNVAKLQTVPRPTGDVVTEGAPEQQADGTWRQTWDVRSYNAEEEAAQLKRAKENAQRRINDGYTVELNAILRDYPDAETKTWDKQESEARAYQDDSAAATPLIDAIAAARSMDKAELVQRVIAKADAWIALSGAATGKRQALEDTIATAETVEAVEAISWN